MIDASVAAKWFVPEDDTDKAIGLRDRFVEGGVDLVAPDLLVYEVVNALRYHPEIGSSMLQEDVDALFSLDLDLVPPSSELVRLSALRAREMEISIYDAAYVILAQETATSLVTADAELHAKVKAKGLSFLLREMGVSWKLP